MNDRLRQPLITDDEKLPCMKYTPGKIADEAAKLVPETPGEPLLARQVDSQRLLKAKRRLGAIAALCAVSSRAVGVLPCRIVYPAAVGGFGDEASSR